MSSGVGGAALVDGKKDWEEETNASAHFSPSLGSGCCFAFYIAGDQKDAKP